MNWTDELRVWIALSHKLLEFGPVDYPRQELYLYQEDLE